MKEKTLDYLITSPEIHRDRFRVGSSTSLRIADRLFFLKGKDANAWDIWVKVPGHTGGNRSPWPVWCMWCTEDGHGEGAEWNNPRTYKGQIGLEPNLTKRCALFGVERLRSQGWWLSKSETLYRRFRDGVPFASLDMNNCFYQNAMIGNTGRPPGTCSDPIGGDVPDGIPAFIIRSGMACSRYGDSDSCKRTEEWIYAKRWGIVRWLGVEQLPDGTRQIAIGPNGKPERTDHNRLKPGRPEPQFPADPRVVDPEWYVFDENREAA